MSNKWWPFNGPPNPPRTPPATTPPAEDPPAAPDPRPDPEVGKPGFGGPGQQRQLKELEKDPTF